MIINSCMGWWLTTLFGLSPRLFIYLFFKETCSPLTAIGKWPDEKKKNRKNQQQGYKPGKFYVHWTIIYPNSSFIGKKKKKKTHLATKFKISNGRSKEMKYEQDFAFDFPKMITNANSSSGKVSLTASITNKVQGKTAR